MFYEEVREEVVDNGRLLLGKSSSPFPRKCGKPSGLSAVVELFAFVDPDLLKHSNYTKMKLQTECEMKKIR